ncbi:unnamed protein product [Pleuronectes platessa]|uniref:Uncharacterized protein n=1 Tax=Pleuronectes platessa TaxID=8262 RepID=A0A9N7TXW9_PLEPL|nr:unnamed protein product [Pleuronectes platessa]
MEEAVEGKRCSMHTTEGLISKLQVAEKSVLIGEQSTTNLPISSDFTQRAIIESVCADLRDAFQFKAGVVHLELHLNHWASLLGSNSAALLCFSSLSSPSAPCPSNSVAIQELGCDPNGASSQCVKKEEEEEVEEEENKRRWAAAESAPRCSGSGACDSRGPDPPPTAPSHHPNKVHSSYFWTVESE